MRKFDDIEISTLALPTHTITADGASFLLQGPSSALWELQLPWSLLVSLHQLSIVCDSEYSTASLCA